MVNANLRPTEILASLAQAHSQFKRVWRSSKARALVDIRKAKMLKTDNRYAINFQANRFAYEAASAEYVIRSNLAYQLRYWSVSAPLDAEHGQSFDDACGFLLSELVTFHSGFVKEAVWRRLKQSDLCEWQKERLREIAVRALVGNCAQVRELTRAMIKHADCHFMERLRTMEESSDNLSVTNRVIRMRQIILTHRKDLRKEFIDPNIRTAQALRDRGSKIQLTSDAGSVEADSLVNRRPVWIALTDLSRSYTLGSVPPHTLAQTAAILADSPFSSAELDHIWRREIGGFGWRLLPKIKSRLANESKPKPFDDHWFCRMSEVHNSHSELLARLRLRVQGPQLLPNRWYSILAQVELIRYSRKTLQ